MSLIINTVPCSDCKKVQVPLGKMGDNGKKRCAKCKYAKYKKYLADYYRNNTKNNKLQELVCFKCGKKYTGRHKTETCEICEMLIVDLYNQSRQQECIYCGRKSGVKKFCSHNCLVKTGKLANKRERKIDEALLDL